MLCGLGFGSFALGWCHVERCAFGLLVLDVVEVDGDGVVEVESVAALVDG